jgi:hypothetical protein
VYCFLGIRVKIISQKCFDILNLVFSSLRFEADVNVYVNWKYCVSKENCSKLKLFVLSVILLISLKVNNIFLCHLFISN